MEKSTGLINWDTVKSLWNTGPVNETEKSDASIVTPVGWDNDAASMQRERIRLTRLLSNVSPSVHVDGHRNESEHVDLFYLSNSGRSIKDQVETLLRKEASHYSLVVAERESPPTDKVGTELGLMVQCLAIRRQAQVKVQIQARKLPGLLAKYARQGGVVILGLIVAYLFILLLKIML